MARCGLLDTPGIKCYHLGVIVAIVSFREVIYIVLISQVLIVPPIYVSPVPSRSFVKPSACTTEGNSMRHTCIQDRVELQASVVRIDLEGL